MKILKLKDTTLDLRVLEEFVIKHNLSQGNKIGISVKVGKKRKLRSYTIDHCCFWFCDTCGAITEISLRKGTVVFKMDNHFGRSSVSLL